MPWPNDRLLSSFARNNCFVLFFARHAVGDDPAREDTPVIQVAAVPVVAPVRLILHCPGWQTELTVL
eukprot:2873310-Amphidinium_carterae.1